VAAPQEVDDGAVVAIVSDGKVGPVPVEISANHDLVIGDRTGVARRNDGNVVEALLGDGS
jgi:hypothetical protein